MTQMKKSKGRPPLRSQLTALGCMLTIIMGALGVALGGLGAMLVAPAFYNLDVTRAAVRADSTALAVTAQWLAGQAQFLDSTRAANMDAATRAALSAQETQAQLVQTATQQQRSIEATQTQQAVISVEQLTRIALDYAGTQAALQQQATQIELDFQATRAALGDDGQAQAEPTNPNSAVSLAMTATPTLTSTPAPTLTPTPTASATGTPSLSRTPTPAAALDVDFETRPAFFNWLYDSSDWSLDEAAGNWVALSDDALLQAAWPDYGNVSVSLTFIPADVGTHRLNFAAEDGTILGIEIISDAGRPRLLRATQRDTSISTPQDIGSTALSLPAAPLALSIRRSDNLLAIQINDQFVLSPIVPVVNGGQRISLQVPQGAALQTLRITPLT